MVDSWTAPDIVDNGEGKGEINEVLLLNITILLYCCSVIILYYYIILLNN